MYNDKNDKPQVYMNGYFDALDEARQIVDILQREQDTKTEIGISITGILNKVNNRIKALQVEQG